MQLPYYYVVAFFNCTYRYQPFFKGNTYDIAVGLTQKPFLLVHSKVHSAKAFEIWVKIYRDTVNATIPIIGFL